MKKTPVLLLCSALLALSLAACGQPAPQEPPSPSPSPAAAEGVDLTILYEADDNMINNYSLLAVAPDAPFTDADGVPVDDVYINTEGAAALVNWLLSDAGRTAVESYGMEDFGEPLFYWKEDAPVPATGWTAAGEADQTIRLSTTTSVNDSGLLAYLLPQFEALTGYHVEVTSAGTGKAIANAKSGNADLLLVHSKSQEEAFVEEGYSYVLPGFDSQRLTFMYNYFVLCGPSADPAGAKDAPSVRDAFAAIATGKHPFISRGDQSGTHTKELSLWPEELGITADAASVEGYADWYTYSNAGMGVCLTMAEETGGYILSDKATFLTFRANSGVLS